MINLEKIKQEKCQPFLSLRPAPAPYFHTTFFLVFQIAPLRGRLKFPSPPLKKGGQNHVGLTNPSRHRDK